MKTIEKVHEVPLTPQDATIPHETHDFFPKGAIAFFAAMLIGFALIWAGLYVLMVHREFHP